jgi:hypothetical protein
VQTVEDDRGESRTTARDLRRHNGAPKQYSRLDRSPHDRTDFQEGLGSTPVMLRGRISHSNVATDCDRSLPLAPVGQRPRT